MNRPSPLDPLEQRLASLSASAQPDDWALTAYRLGVALTETPGDDPKASATRAIQLFARAAALLDAQRAPVEHARIVNASGAAWRMLGDRAKAIEDFRFAAGLMDGRARAAEAGAAWSNLGLALAEHGDVTQAIATFERALSILRPPPLGVGIGIDEWRERARAFAAAALNRAQALLGVEGPEAGVDAIATIAEALVLVDVDTAPMQVAMLQHTLGLVHMNGLDAPAAALAFTHSLGVFTRSAFPFHHAIASFNRGRAHEAMGDLGRSLFDYEAAVQVFDPRLHRPQWHEAATRLAEVDRTLTLRSPGRQRHDHLVRVLADVSAPERLALLRERMTRLLSTAREPQRAELAKHFAALLRLGQAFGSRADSDADLRAESDADSVLRSTLEVVMELPDAILHSTLLGLLDASSMLTPEDREVADRRLDRAIQELLMGPQRVRIRDILYAEGWVRP